VRTKGPGDDDVEMAGMTGVLLAVARKGLFIGRRR